jgi:hypothetical protein
MNWRRGLLLAGIHLAVAVPMVIWQEARDWSSLRTEWEPAQRPALRMAAQQEDERVNFYPCDLWESIPATTIVLIIEELPAAFAVGIGENCPPIWTVAGSVRAALDTPPYRSNRAAEASIAASFCAYSLLSRGYCSADSHSSIPVDGGSNRVPSSLGARQHRVPFSW